MRVLRIDEKLARLPKQAMQPVETLPLSPGDCLVLCAGFEERVTAALNKALSGNVPFKVILIQYLPFIPQNCSSTIKEKCARAGVSMVELSYDRQNPAGFGKVLSDQIEGFSGRIFIDVSGMSRLLIVQALVALGNRPARFSNCSVAYSQAQIYPPTKEEAEAAVAKLSTDPTYSVLFLSSGVFDVTIVPELSSVSIPLGQTRLIAFPSLDSYQLTALRAELQPSRFTFVDGIPPDPQNAWRPETIRKINRLDSIVHDTCRAGTLDYRETLDCLLQLYGKHSARERLLISPTGSKMQTVAVGLFRAFMDDVQIVYPTPKEFRSPSNYTKGVGQLYTLALDDFTLNPKLA